MERETGLTRETLRIWERRYGFPNPSRNAVGDRTYNGWEVDQLLLIKRLLEMGYRPGRVVPLPREDLLRLGQSLPSSQTDVQAPTDQRRQEYLDLLGQARLGDLDRGLDQALLRLGLAELIHTVIAPLTEAVGDAWLRGELSVHDEHAYTEIITRLLRRALDKLPQPSGRPRILMTTLAGELHGLGLLMAECLLTLDGANCLSLGVNLPNTEIAAAVGTYDVQVVALSFSPAYPRRQISGALRGLRELLPDEVEIWAGGTAMQHLRLPPGVNRCVKFADATDNLVGWRQRHPGA